MSSERRGREEGKGRERQREEKRGEEGREEENYLKISLTNMVMQKTTQAAMTAVMHTCDISNSSCTYPAFAGYAGSTGAGVAARAAINAWYAVSCALYARDCVLYVASCASRARLRAYRTGEVWVGIVD